MKLEPLDSKAPKKRTRKSPAKPTEPEAPRTVKKVEHPPTEKPVLKVETPEPRSYEKRAKVGTPKLGRSPNYVETVGLGKLKVITVHGNTDV